MLLNVIHTFTILSSISVIEVIKSWDLLNTVGLNTSEISIKHIKIIKDKAYLSIPRIKDDQKITFVEATWPENLRSNVNIPKVYPNEQLQIISKCDNLQSAICSDADSLGKLYILDKGYGHCPPKIVVYDTINHKQATICHLTDVNSSSLQDIVVDRFSTGGPRAYIGVSDNEGLIIYSLQENRWWFVNLYPPTTSNFTESSEEKENTERRVTSKPQQLALSRIKPIIYFTSNDTKYLFSINASLLREIPIPPHHFCNSIKLSENTINVTLEDRKLGPSVVLACDFRGGLYYYVLKDYLLVHWDNRTRFSVECYDEALIQTDLSLPQHVEQIIVTMQLEQLEVWLLLGLPNKNGNHCIKLPKTKVQHLEEIIN